MRSPQAGVLAVSLWYKNDFSGLLGTTSDMPLTERARRKRVPVIYVNDNLGKWRSDINALVAFCQRPGMPGAKVVETLCPRPEDHVVLKSTLSGFFQTPLDTMLRSGGITTLVMTGFATDNCVLFTAADAYMRDYKLIVPRDCVAAQSAHEDRSAIRRMHTLFGARVGRSSDLTLLR